MCAIFGALVWGQINPRLNDLTNKVMSHIYAHAFERRRDGRGYLMEEPDDSKMVIVKRINRQEFAAPGEGPVFARGFGCRSVIGNTRAEPTTEFVKNKTPNDQQPYTSGPWSIVHNGTIANDKELRAAYKTDRPVDTTVDSAAIAEVLHHYSSIYEDNDFTAFVEAVKRLKGSYAILATKEVSDEIYVAANYRPIWYAVCRFGVFFASTRESFPPQYVPKMVTPYTAMRFVHDGNVLAITVKNLRPNNDHIKPTALVVCSGGLDSVVSAVYAQKVLDMDVELIHFLYGSRAQGPEVEAVKRVADHMGVKLKLFDLPVYDKSDSPLLDPDSKVAGGEAGAEFAHEWVPARNLLLLSVATAYAEAKGHTVLVLGNNLEEAGAYPDNEPEFIAKFNDLLPFAIGDGKRLEVIMPVGNMMKHEIVALGIKIGAPMHLTWSCYRAGEKHCGTCGPCYMRRTAFSINGIPEVIEYDS